MTQKTTIGLMLTGLLSVAGAASAGDYIGAEKCKMCHMVEFKSWSGTPHAKAFARLKPEEQGKAECLKCHATGARASLPGVQCEACHGAGSEYKAMDVMKDHAASVAKGLIVPNEGTCKGCHVGAPHDQPAFDYAAATAKKVHDVKPKPAPK
jgi:nitrate/TMAO reductase-like tetraheme cytochrome c subunit